MEKLRRQRQDRLEQHDLGGVYNEIADELNDIVDEERQALDDHAARRRAAATSARQDLAECAAAERNFRLDMLPDDLAGKVRELQELRLRVAGGGAALRAAAWTSSASSSCSDRRPDGRRACRT